MYSIGQVAEMFGLPISTLRYYDKQGLFPNMERVSGIRKFSEAEIEALRVIECLKKAGMEIKDIRQFMDWCVEGPATYPQRKAMFEAQRVHMEAELEHMNRTLDMLKFKCWYYEQAIKDGSEDRLKSLIPDRLPEEIRKAYENAHRYIQGKKSACPRQKLQRGGVMLLKRPRRSIFEKNGIFCKKVIYKKIGIAF